MHNAKSETPLTFDFQPTTRNFISGVVGSNLPLISRSEWQKSEKIRLGLKSVRDAKSKTPLTFDFRPKTRIFIFGGGGFEPLPPDFKVWMKKIWKNKVWAEISARCQVRNTPYFWFSVKNTEFHLWEWWVRTPPDLKVWTAKNWKTKVWAEISAQCQVRNTPYFWFSAKNKDFQFWR